MKTSRKSTFVLATLVITLLAIQLSFGQQTITPPVQVRTNFETVFKNATSVNWNKSAPLYYATFSYQGESRIAFMDMNGEVITSGRRISVNQLPLVVQDELNSVIPLHEKKMGTLKPGSIYEMTKSGMTEYYIPFESESNRLTLKSYGHGQLIVVAKDRKSFTESIQNDVIAKK